MLGKKVMVLDYVVPTPKGTTWGKPLPLQDTLRDACDASDAFESVVNA